MGHNFDAARLRSERDQNRGYRAARQDVNHGTGGIGFVAARDNAREAQTARDRDYWMGYATAMKATGKR